MDKYTLKDFIKYCSPCFSCSNKICIRVSVHDSVLNETFLLKPIFEKEYMSIDLKFTYYENLNIRIYYKNNNFITNNLRSLTKYFQQYTLQLRALCDKCDTFVLSQDLNFNTKRIYLDPISISNEVIYIKDNNISYSLYSDYKKNKSILNINKEFENALSAKDIILPLITMSSVKDRDRLLNKIKKIILFS